MTSLNQVPVANAGPDQTVQEGDTVTLNGSGSSDPDGGSLTYQWVQKSGAIVQLSSSSLANPTLVAPSSAIPIVFELTVTDAGQLTAKDSVSINVAAPAPPVVSQGWGLYYPHVVSNLNAGKDKIWETEIVMINTGNDPLNGSFMAYNKDGDEVSTAVPVEDLVGRKGFLVGEAFDTPDQIRYIVFECDGEGSAVGYESLAVNGVCRTTFEAFCVCACLSSTSEEDTGDDFQPPITEGRASSAVPAASGVFMKLTREEWTGLVFLNPGDTVTVDLLAYNDDGQAVAAGSFAIGAGDHRSGFAIGFFPDGTDLSAATYLKYSASGDIIAVQFTGDYNGSMLDSMPGA